ncbi:MAG: DUF4982 domain-containing protein [Akkermansiaceae bacterium]|nr:DUF4982 domain-containing protein [Verrucomicrobiales bacterium]
MQRTASFPLRLNLVSLLIALLTATTIQAAENSRLHENFDLGWRFFQGDITNAQATGLNDRPWKKINVPHDWSIAGPYSETNITTGRGGYLPAGIGWYRKSFSMPEILRGKKVVVQFDGVYKNSDVWINGQHLGHYPFGYLGFAYDLTPHLNFGGTPNVIAVRVDNSQHPNSRWYSGSGIQRHVWITVTDPLHVARWGTYITTPQATTNSATMRVRTKIQNDHATEKTVTLISQLLGENGGIVGTAEKQETLSANTSREFDQTIQVLNPQLWSLDAPHLYRVRNLVRSGDQTVDDYETPVGIREIRYDTDKGFFLNGAHVKMQGMCLHHDGGCVGAAVPEDVWARRLKLLKEMGCNAIRMSHNPPTPELLDLCDQMGFLVMDESFDEWKSGKTPHGYSKVYAEWAIKDLTAMLHRDRNHPSVVIWSVGNEVYEQSAGNGTNVLRPLLDTCHAEDPTRPVTVACDRITADDAPAKYDFLNSLDVVGYNYADRWRNRRETLYAEDRHQFPHWKMIGSESTCIGGVRGDYTFAPLGPEKLTRAVYATAMLRAEQLWRFVRLHDYVIGDFMWTGIDYLGESRWPRKSTTYGPLDLCGFPKDSYYFYQSQWAAKPMLHLFPHWNWQGRKGQVIPVICYTSCNTVELFLNGKSFGAKALEFPRQGTSGGWNRYARPEIFPTTADLHLSWDVPYEPGVLKAIGYKDGKKVCEQEIRTTGTPAAIVLSTDRETLKAGSREVAHLSVKIVDAQGNVVPKANNLVTFNLQGAGTLLGVDNGNPEDHASYQLNHRHAFDGLCLAIIQAGFESGELRVTASADGLQGATVNLNVQPNTGAKRPVISTVD